MNDQSCEDEEGFRNVRQVVGRVIAHLKRVEF